MSAATLALEFPTFRKFSISLHDHFIPHPRNNYHPHILSHRMLALLSLLLMTVKIAAISLVVVAPPAAVQASEITSSTVIELANAARADAGLGTLKGNSVLSKAAQAKANDMLARQYFAHNTPTGETPWTFIKAAGYSYLTAGENLAIDFTEAESIQTAWMNSPGHRANIMNSAFQEIGIGISKGMFNGHQTTIVVQMFGTPIAQQVNLDAAPTPVVKSATDAKPAPTTAPAKVAAAPSKNSVVTPVATPKTTPQEAPQAAPTLVAEKSTPTFNPPIVGTESDVAAVPVGTQQLEIKSTQTSLQGNQLYITVTASGDATKLLATYGSNAVMLDPMENNEWHGYIPLASLNPNVNLLVYAYDINGNLTHSSVAQFSPSLNPKTSVSADGPSVTILGKVINPGAWSEKIILLILAAIIASLMLAIGIRRHVQHLGLIANASFVAMLAAFMLMV